ncbi:hypothetical protein HQ545_07935 [Candidatus Woesearchaeota archaeon]|nr:hypothetical protein [Candidatus Woesearchaeota archaeon]
MTLSDRVKKLSRGIKRQTNNAVVAGTVAAATSLGYGFDAHAEQATPVESTESSETRRIKLTEAGFREEVSQLVNTYDIELSSKNVAVLPGLGDAVSTEDGWEPARENQLFSKAEVDAIKRVSHGYTNHADIKRGPVLVGLDENGRGDLSETSLFFYLSSDRTTKGAQRAKAAQPSYRVSGIDDSVRELLQKAGVEGPIRKNLVYAGDHRADWFFNSVELSFLGNVLMDYRPDGERMSFDENLTFANAQTRRGEGMLSKNKLVVLCRGNYDGDEEVLSLSADGSCEQTMDLVYVCERNKNGCMGVDCETSDPRRLGNRVSKSGTQSIILNEQYELRHIRLAKLSEGIMYNDPVSGNQRIAQYFFRVPGSLIALDAGSEGAAPSSGEGQQASDDNLINPPRVPDIDPEEGSEGLTVVPVEPTRTRRGFAFSVGPEVSYVNLDSIIGSNGTVVAGPRFDMEFPNGFTVYSSFGLNAIFRNSDSRTVDEVVAGSEHNMTADYPFNPTGVDVAIREHTNYTDRDSTDLVFVVNAGVGYTARLGNHRLRVTGGVAVAGVNNEHGSDGYMGQGELRIGEGEWEPQYGEHGAEYVSNLGFDVGSFDDGVSVDSESERLHVSAGPRVGFAYSPIPQVMFGANGALLLPVDRRDDGVGFSVGGYVQVRLEGNRD